MSLNRRNTTFVLCGLALGTGLAIAGARAQSSQPQSPAAPKLAEEEFKNIKVLKGIPADQVRPSMTFITASLGVECEYCHVRGDKGLEFEKDDKKTKVTAPLGRPRCRLLRTSVVRGRSSGPYCLSNTSVSSLLAPLSCVPVRYPDRL